MIAVIDTNIFMAALLNPIGAAAKIRNRWRQSQFEVFISDPVFEEYSDVLRHAPTLSARDVQILLDELQSLAQYVTIAGTLQACKDPDDDIFLETALASDADFLVTKNLKHFPYKSYEGCAS